MIEPSHPQRPRIGIFDSGVGGLSVLSAVRHRLPHADLFYLADSAHAPYGEKGDTYVQARSQAIADQFRAIDADLLVIACNTATAAAADVLREHHAGWPIVGVEPGIKPAAALTRNGRIGVLATEVTLRSQRFQLLAQAHAAHVQLLLQPCPGLAAAIEGGDRDAPAVRAVVATCCEALRAASVDTVVLGCTHYPFVAHHIQAELGTDVTLVDTAEAVARQTEALCPVRPASQTLPVTALGQTQLWTTGSVDLLKQVAAHWLDFACTVKPLTRP